jgi:hypothetical protein
MLNLQLRGFNAACSMIDEFSLTVHSSSLQFKYDGRSSIQFTVQFSSVYSLQFKYGGCSSMQFTVQFSSVHSSQYKQTRNSFHRNLYGSQKKYAFTKQSAQTSGAASCSTMPHLKTVEDNKNDVL